MEKPKQRKCGWWGHNWSKWEIAYRADILRTSDKNVIGKAVIQERKCLDCNFLQINKQQVT